MSEKKMTYEDEITASHPMELDTPEGFAADMLAMTLVGERHSKRDLVNLVRWLILDKAGRCNADLKIDR